MTSLNGKNYNSPKPFKNITVYKVGQVRTYNNSKVMITAILRITDNQYGIYSYPIQQSVKLDLCQEQQDRREKGQMNIIVTGRLLFVEKIN